jgi:NADPH:quinone reductase-like Zn-dependent oxidoreductase
MSAIVLLKREGRTVLELQELPSPVPGPGEALVEVRAAALNHLDLYAQDHHAAESQAPPQIIGSDAAGVVLEVGPGVDSDRVGEEVVLNPGLSCGHCEACQRGEQSECPGFDIVGRGLSGTFASRVAVPAKNLYPKPPHLGFEEAAALPLAHLTAWRMLVRRGALSPGQSVLIHGIGGGVALAALQLAKLCGAEVIVTSSSGEKLERAARLGADHGIDYGAVANVAEEVRTVTGGRGVDLVIDTVGAVTLPSSVGATRNGGRVVVCGATTGAEAAVNVREIFWRQIILLGSTMGSHEDFFRMLQTVTANRITPVIDSVRPLAEASAALERMRQGRQFGKIVLSTGKSA